MKHLDLINKMTLEEKAALMSGKGFWETVDSKRLGIPSIFLSDGPHGIRKQAGNADHLGLNASVPATCFPTASAMANTWNPQMIKAIGQYLGKEAKAQDVNIVLGPGLNIKRSPLCGRNFEYFSEDPYLSGRMAAGLIEGIQSEGVGACPKHYAVNSQELRRMSNDSILDERTLREIYTTGFEIAVKEGKAKSIMTSYNKVNGVYANEHELLLQSMLVDEWGFDGIVVSDWGASNDHAEGVRVGSHLEMPTTGNDGKRLLLEAIKKGTLTEEVLNERVDTLLDMVLELSTQKDSKEKKDFDVDEHHNKAKQAAEECIVLLKNEQSLLPLKKETKIAIIGDFAKQPRYQGAGSSQVNPTKIDNALDVISKMNIELLGYAQGFTRNGSSDARLKQEALELAKQAEVVVLYLGLSEIEESEGLDREHMVLANNQVELLKDISKFNENIVVVLSAGCAIEMPWLAHTKALVHGYLPGQAGAESILNVLYGEICPSGRLAETYPLKYEDTPCAKYYPGLEKTSEYRESIFVGYRYYETVGVPTLFPFGYGLSYTTFSYSNLKVTKEGVQVTVTNTGKVVGAEVVQMYVSMKESKIFRAIRELKGFTKVYLEPGESIEVELPFDDKTFRFFHVKTKQWEVEGGTYYVQIAKNAHEVVLEEAIQLEGTTTEFPYNKEQLKEYYTGQIKDVSDGSFEALLGHKIPESKWDRQKSLGLNDTISQMYYAKSWLARMVIKIITRLKDNSIKKGTPNLNILFIYNMPFRAIAKMMGGAVSMNMVEAILEMVNGKFFRGFKHLVVAAFRNRK